MGKTETTLAEFVLDFSTEEIPPDVMHLAKRCLMNYAGVALYATLDPAIDILLDLLRAESCAPKATVIGSGFRTSPQNAALAQNQGCTHCQSFAVALQLVLFERGASFVAPEHSCTTDGKRVKCK